MCLFSLTERGLAQPICDDGYGLCMRNCSDDRMAERCMQRCQEAAQRCEKSGVFRMPVGFILNKRRLEDMAYAESPLFRAPKQKRTGREGIR